MNIVLGSQSAQRRRLLQSILADRAFDVITPENHDEPGFDDCTDRPAIQQRLELIVQQKTDDVKQQLIRQNRWPDSCLICADTTVVVNAPDEAKPFRVLGKPDVNNPSRQIAEWFERYYSGTTHEVWTAFQVTCGDAGHDEVVRTEVRFSTLSADWIDWYVETGEGEGKAGGYGIQGHAAAFVESLQGSLTSIIGLPVFELRQALQRLGVL